MRAVTPRAARPDPAPYAAAEVAFAEAKAYLSSREAQQMSESDLERELHRRGQELMRKLLQGHLDQRSPGEAAGPVEGADGVERSERRVHERHLETIFGTVQVERVGYARAGHESLHPLDAALNLPGERYSLEVRRRVAAAAASRSFDEALLDLSHSTGAEVPKRQAEQLVVRAAEDFDAFYEARRAAEGEPPPEGSVVVLTFDGKGVVLHREDLRKATRKAAERRRQHREPLSRFHRLKPGEKKHSKRMATVAAVYTTGPFVRSPEDFLESLMPRQPRDKPRDKPRAVRPRPVAKRVWASLEREPWEGGRGGDAGSGAPGPRARQALGRARRRGRAAARPRGSGRRRLRRGRHGDTRHHPRGRVCLEGGAGVPSRGEPRVDSLGLDARAEHSRGQGQEGGGGDAARGDRRRLLEGHPQAGRQVRRLPAEIRAVSALRPLPRGRLSHRDRGHRRGVPVPGPRPYGVDRSPLAPGWSRGRPEAPGATGERRLRCVLGLPRSAGVRAEPRPALHGWDSTAGHRAAPTALLTPPSTSQVTLAMPLAETPWAADEEEPHPSELGAADDEPPLPGLQAFQAVHVPTPGCCS